MSKQNETSVFEKPAPEVAAKKDSNAGLTRLVNGSDELYVHPTCVQAHLDAGWKLEK